MLHCTAPRKPETGDYQEQIGNQTPSLKFSQWIHHFFFSTSKHSQAFL